MQKRAHVRTITAENIINALDLITEKVKDFGFFYCGEQKYLISLGPSARHIGNRQLEGLTVDIDIHASTFPRAYKYTPESTHFSAIFHGGKWRVTQITRDSTRENAFQMVLPDALKKKIIDTIENNPETEHDK